MMEQLKPESPHDSKQLTIYLHLLVIKDISDKPDNMYINILVYLSSVFCVC